jgi:hypothetical protein
MASKIPGVAQRVEGLFSVAVMNSPFSLSLTAAGVSITSGDCCYAPVLGDVG